MDRTPVFHIGFPKAGSTTLQRRVFSCHKDIAYAGLYPKAKRLAVEADNSDAKANNELYRLSSRLFGVLFKTDGMTYDSEVATDLLHSIYSNIGNGVPVFSHESATGVALAFPDFVSKAQRIQELFGEVKILLIVREQLAWLKSQYRDYPFDPGNIKKGAPVNFETWLKLDMDRRYFQFTKIIEYHKIADYYAKLFSKENVLVLPLELMQYRPEDFAMRMANFMDVSSEGMMDLIISQPKENTGYSEKLNRYRRVRRLFSGVPSIGKILPQSIRRKCINWLERGSPGQTKLSKETENFLKEKYQTSNSILAQEWELDLNELGYSVSE